VASLLSTCPTFSGLSTPPREKAPVSLSPRRIVEEHHGRIEVSSVVGKGTEFEVVLPFSMPASEVAAS
jgi:sensor histidine kinase regulating citrate/malate metabolism